MTSIYTIFTFLSTLFYFLPFGSVVAASYQGTSARAISQNKYTKAHSLGDDYIFDSRDGWFTINATDLKYKYRRGAQFDSAAPGESSSQRRAFGKKEASGQKSAISMTVSDVVKQFWKGLKGLGKTEEVSITWYTGNDLKNPSCWANGKWAPTDQSFACAVTLTGWINRPQCFKFIELCNTPKKCIFVRVVDTCAGCATGSHHADLTRAAFGQLASFDKGILTVEMRMATEPTEWHDNLWGPPVGK